MVFEDHHLPLRYLLFRPVYTLVLLSYEALKDIIGGIPHMFSEEGLENLHCLGTRSLRSLDFSSCDWSH